MMTMRSRHALWTIGMAVAGGALIRGLLRWRRRMSFSGKTVIITGGSRGLGLEIGRLLAEEGARLVLLARDPEELERARRELERLRADVLPIRCDVTAPEQVGDAVERAVRAYGRVDVLVNAAGVIQVGPLSRMTTQDFQRAMAVHFWGALHCIQAVLPHLERQGGGRIVNITSVGGRVPVPHLAPYVASKFALVGLSAALRVELASRGIWVSTIVPGLMRTGSHVRAQFKGDARREFAWFSILGAQPAFSMSARRAARQIVEACRYGDAWRTLSLQARVLELAQQLYPELMSELLSLVSSVLPRGGDSSAATPGREVWSPSILTRLSDRAAARNNELGS